MSVIKEYLERISRIPINDVETNIECFKALSDPDVDEKKKREIRDHLVTSNLKLVVSIAKKYRTTDELPLIDVIQEGNIGLMKAIEKYDYRRGNRFSTYATWWIRQAISMNFSKNGRTVRLPTHVLGVQRKIAKAIEEYNEEYGCDPTIEELKLLLSDVSEKVLEATLHAAKGTVSLTAANSDDEKSHNLENKISDASILDPYELMSNSQTLDIVMNVLSELTDREEAVIRMRFGLYDMGLDREDFIEEE